MGRWVEGSGLGVGMGRGGGGGRTQTATVTEATARGPARGPAAGRSRSVDDDASGTNFASVRFARDDRELRPRVEAGNRSRIEARDANAASDTSDVRFAPRATFASRRERRSLRAASDVRFAPRATFASRREQRSLRAASDVRFAPRATFASRREQRSLRAASDVRFAPSDVRFARTRFADGGGGAHTESQAERPVVWRDETKRCAFGASTDGGLGCV